MTRRALSDSRRASPGGQRVSRKKFDVWMAHLRAENSPGADQFGGLEDRRPSYMPREELGRLLMAASDPRGPLTPAQRSEALYRLANPWSWVESPPKSPRQAWTTKRSRTERKHTKRLIDKLAVTTRRRLAERDRLVERQKRAFKRRAKSRQEPPTLLERVNVKKWEAARRRGQRKDRKGRKGRKGRR